MRRPTRTTPLALVCVCVLAGVACSAADEDGRDAEDTTTTTMPLEEAGLPPVRFVPTGLEVDQPIAAVPSPDGTTLLVAERGGRVLEASVEGDALEALPGSVVDLSAAVGTTEGERGLLGLAVAPDGEHLYASYTRAGDGASRVEQLPLERRDGRWRADADDARTLVAVDQPFPNHNGGHLAIGPDGMLYVGLGDGGAGGDPGGRAQDPTTLLGKLLRLDPDAEPPVPADNPFVGDDELGARDEIWSTGLRNPWRFSFDRDTGDLWIGDVGQDRIEEIDLLRAEDGAGRGANLGWDLFEGDEAYEDADPAPGAASDGPFVEPVFTYGHDAGCSVTGGVVYRGSALPGLRGTYLYGDLCEDGVRALRASGDGFEPLQLTENPGSVVGFAEDVDGEVLVLSLSEGVLRLRAA